MAKIGKFTFKTEKSTGRYRNFLPDIHIIKLNKLEIGNIHDKNPHTIRLMVIKKDINEDGNPNCEWKWIKLKKESKSLQEAKDFLNENFEAITKHYNIYMLKE